MINTHVFGTTTDETRNTMCASYACMTLPVCLFVVNTLCFARTLVHFCLSLHLIPAPITPYHHFTTERHAKSFLSQILP